MGVMIHLSLVWDYGFEWIHHGSKLSSDPEPTTSCHDATTQAGSVELCGCIAGRNGGKGFGFDPRCECVLNSGILRG